jgi:hypothetical protein
LVEFGRFKPRDFGMEKSRLSEQQIAFILKQTESGTNIEKVCRKASIFCAYPTALPMIFLAVKSPHIMLV